jgi:nitric oxide dioxygenase
MLEDIVATPDTQSTPAVTWIHGCRSEQVHAFKDKIAEICTSYKQLDQHIFYENEQSPEKNHYQGRVELEILKNEILKPETDYYICGPAPFISKHYEFLITNGVPVGTIHFEEFGPASLQLN